MERGRPFTTVIRKATNNNKKAIKKWQERYDPKEPIEDHDYDAAICRRSLRSKFRHHFTSPGACIEEWKDVLHGDTQDCKKYKKKLWYTRILTSNATCTALARLLSGFGRPIGRRSLPECPTF